MLHSSTTQYNLGYSGNVLFLLLQSPPAPKRMEELLYPSLLREIILPVLQALTIFIALLGQPISTTYRYCRTSDTIR